MPLIRYIYGPDVRQFGDRPMSVEDVTARHVVAARRAVLVDASELEALPKAELAQLAEQVGADVKKRDSKGHFVKQIVEAEGQ